MRRKTQKRSASSSLAAASGVDAPLAFTSFAAATAEVLGSRSSTAPPAGVLSDWDSNALQVLRSCTKKDDSTRAKSLVDIKSLIEQLSPPQQPAVGIAFVNAWASQFPSLVSDSAPNVRTGALEVMCLVVRVWKKKTQPVLNSVLPHWVSSLGDPTPVVSTVAAKSLEEAFPDESKRRILGEHFGEVLGEFCSSEFQALRTTEDEVQLRKIIAVARWTIGTTSSLEHMSRLLDDNMLFQLGTGVKTVKKERKRLAAPDEVCELAINVILPVLKADFLRTVDTQDKRDDSTTDSDKPASLPGNRGRKLAELSIALIRTGKVAGMDLLLALLRNDTHESVPDWKQVTGAIKSCMKYPAPAFLNALLPLFHLLPPNQDHSRTLVEDVLELLYRAIMPKNSEAQDYSGNVDIPAVFVSHEESNDSSRRTTTLAASRCLLSFVECVSYSVGAGSRTWIRDDPERTAFQEELVQSRVKPVLLSYFRGSVLVPRSITRSSAIDPSAGGVLHNDGSVVRPEQFASPVCALNSDSAHSLLTWLATNLIPLREQSGALIHRLISFLHGLHQKNDRYSTHFLKSLLPLLTSEQYSLEEQRSHLQILAQASNILFDVRLVTSDVPDLRAMSFALSHLKAASDDNLISEAVATVLSWFCLVPGKSRETDWTSLVLAQVRALVLQDDSYAASLFTDVLRVHKRRRAGMEKNCEEAANHSKSEHEISTLRWSPVCSRSLDEFTLGLARKATSCELECDRSVINAFLCEAIDTQGGAQLGECTFSSIAASVSETLPSVCSASLLHLAEKILAACASDPAANDTAMGLANRIVVYRAGEYGTNFDCRVFKTLDSFFGSMSIPVQESSVRTVLEMMQREVRLSASFNDLVRHAQVFSAAVVRLLQSLGREGLNLRDKHDELLGIFEPVVHGSHELFASDSRTSYIQHVFASAMFLAAGRSSVLVARNNQQQVDPELFVREYERIVFLRLSGQTSMASEVETTLMSILNEHVVDPMSLSPVLQMVIVRSMVLNRGQDELELEAPSSSPAIPVRHESDLLEDHLLKLVGALMRLDSPNLGCERTGSLLGAVADALDARNPLAPRILSVCLSECPAGNLLYFRETLEHAAQVLSSKESPTEIEYTLRLVSSVLPVSGTWYQWKNNSVKNVFVPEWCTVLFCRMLRDARSILDSSSLFLMGTMGCIRTLRFVSKCFAYGFELPEDDCRFWALKVIEGFRELPMGEFGAQSERTHQEYGITLSNLAAHIVDAFERRSPASRHLPSCDVDEITHIGAWAGVRHFSRTPTCHRPGFLYLMARAVEYDLLYRENMSVAVSDNEAYRMIECFRNECCETRKVTFAVILRVASQNLHAVAREQFLGADQLDEEDRFERACRIVPRPFQKALRWLSLPNSEDNSVEYVEELRYFMTWLLLIEITHQTGRDCNDLANERNAAQSPSVSEDLGGYDGEDVSFRRAVVEYLRGCEEIFQEYVKRCVDIVADGSAVEKAAAAFGASSSLPQPVLTWVSSSDVTDGMEKLSGSFAGASFAQTLRRLPAISRTVIVDNIERGQAVRIEDFVRRRISPHLVSEEIQKVLDWSVHQNDIGSSTVDGALKARASTAAREVWATYRVSDVNLEVALRLPDSFPLRTAKVVDDADGIIHVGMSKTLWRKTILAMNTLLRLKDGSLAEALELWRRNLDKTLEGVEECPICYSVLHLSTAALPKMQCRTCKKHFHSQCLCKWFTKSNNPSCPLCRSPF